MKKIKLLDFIFLMVLLCSCTNDSDLLSGEDVLKNRAHLLSQIQIKQMLDNMNSLGQSTKSTATNISYSEISSYEVQCVDTINQHSENITISQYKVKNQDKEGYAIVLNDNRFPVVLAYVPQGNLSDTTKIEPLNMFFRGIPTAVNALYNHPNRALIGGKKIGRWNETKTAWHESYPYNNKIPTSSTLHPDAGTHVSSIAQLCAYYKKGSYNWGTLLSSPTISSEETTRVEMVSSLYLDVFNKTNTKFPDGYARTSITDAIQGLKSLGFKQAHELSMKNVQTARSSIYNDILGGGIVMMQGDRYINGKKNDTHYWLVEGIFVSMNDQYDPVFDAFVDLCCNWGQYNGLSNGTFAWLPNGNLLTAGMMGDDRNSYKYIKAVIGIK